MTKNELLKLPSGTFFQIYTESGLSKTAFCRKFQISNTAFERRACLICAEQKMNASVSETSIHNETLGLSRKELLALPADRFAALFMDSGLTRMEFAAYKQISLNTVKNRLKEANSIVSKTESSSVSETEEKIEIVTIDLDEPKADTLQKSNGEITRDESNGDAVRMLFRGIPLTIMNNAMEQTLRSVFHILQEVAD